jgi:hypothetical protein
MEKFCKQTISDIKMATDEAELIHVIRASLSSLRIERRSFNESGFITNMIVSLRTTDKTGLSSECLEKIKLAGAIFRQLQNERRSPIF